MERTPRTPLQRLQELAEDILAGARHPADIYLTDQRSEISHLLHLIDGSNRLFFPSEHTEAFLDELYAHALREYSPPASDDDEPERAPVFMSGSDTSSTTATDDVSTEDVVMQ
eukprot:GHVU01222623.1.p2 GENE.GHVU01222623.1~~GHVU01222623.1.p2  ORF type:complete len:113 (-),score=15.59 GHVU01222623.1:473-811(-)